MKLKRITDAEINDAEINEVISQYDTSARGKGRLAEAMRVAIAQAQLEADQKMVDTLELAREGYTEMTVREIFGEIEALFDNEPTHHTFVRTQSVEECYLIRVKDWQALKQKYPGGEK